MIQFVEIYPSTSRHKEDLKKYSGQAPKEELLFHGTNDEDVVRMICSENFDNRVYGKNGTVYGKGAYFARDANYSHGYTASSGIKHMFLASVLAGRYTQGSSDMNRPPEIPGESTKRDIKRYDSTVNNTNNPSIYVLYTPEKCYPSYLILYRNTGDTSAVWKPYADVGGSGDGIYKGSYSPPPRPTTSQYYSSGTTTSGYQANPGSQAKGSCAIQ